VANNTNDLLFDLSGLSSSAVMSTLIQFFQLASDLLTYMLLSGVLGLCCFPLTSSSLFPIQSGSNNPARCSIQGEPGDVSLTQATLTDLKFILYNCSHMSIWTSCSRYTIVQWLAIIQSRNMQFWTMSRRQFLSAHSL